MDSQTAVDSLLEVDPGFVDLCQTLLGDAVEPAEVWQFMYGMDSSVVKMADPSEVHVNRGIGTERPRTNKAKVKVGRKKLVATAAASAATVAAARMWGDGDNPPRKGSSNMYGYSVTPVGKPVEVVSSKADDGESVTWTCTFSKFDEDKRQVFGWASVVEVDGQPVIDRQGDWITPDEIEKAAYEYVIKSRVGGHQHKRTEQGAFHASDMIESIVFTPEKIAKMGLPDDFPVGWWVGYKVRDDETWAKVKKGDITGFSIHGRGKRAQVGELEV